MEVDKLEGVNLMATGAFATAARTAIEFKPMMYMQEYIEQKIAERQHPSTIRGARTSLHYFAEFCRSQGVESPEEIKRIDIIRFQAWCNQKVADEQWAKSYSAFVLRKVQAWINWLVSLNYITTQPWSNIRVPTIEKQPKPLSNEDVDLLFAAHRRDAFRIDAFAFHRRETMLALLYGWGLRLHELESLTMAQMDSRLDIILVKNKGTDKPKRLPYTPEIKAIVERWLRHRAQYAVPGIDSLLITSSGNTLTKEYMYGLVVELGKLAGVAVNPHRLRDTFGTNMLDDDVPAERVQAMFGHTNLRQTLQYARVNDTKVYESLERNMDPRLRNLFHNTRDLRDS